MVRKSSYASRPADARQAYPLSARIRNEGGATRVDVYDEIGAGDWSGEGLTAKDFAAQIADVKGPLSCHINSCGGDVFDGLAIFNALRQYAGRVTTVVDGLAASIASVIFQAGDDRVVSPGSMVMIHDAFGFCLGNASEMTTMAGTLDKVSASLAAVYAERCGGTADTWRDAMSAETWYTADEAVTAGLADRVAGGAAQLPASVAAAAAGTVPGRIAARLRVMPQAAALRSSRPAAAAAAPVAARLDGHGWARSWGAFLNAIADEDDRLGARREIRKVMDSEEFRPKDALGERVPAEGGYLVPWSLTEEVLVYLTEAVIRPRATPVAMDGLLQNLPSLDNPSQASGAQGLGGLTFAMVATGAAIPATNPQFGRVQLEARKLAALMTQVPNELIDDSPAFNDFLARVIGMGFAWALDDLDFNGTGVGEPQGILNAPGALSVTRANTGNAPGHVDVVAMLKALHPASKAKATWLMSEDVFDALLELYEVAGTAPSGEQIPPPQTLVFDAASGCWRLLGLPAMVTDHQPAAGTRGDLALADLSLYLAGMRQELIVERGAKGRGFANDASDLRVKARVDGRYWPQSPYTLANGKVTSPLVVLN